jgi:hypothetical protein
MLIIFHHLLNPYCEEFIFFYQDIMRKLTPQIPLRTITQLAVIYHDIIVLQTNRALFKYLMSIHNLYTESAPSFCGMS